MHASARLFEDSRSSEDFQLSTFDELSPIVDHKVSIMRGDQLSMLPFGRY